MLQKRSLLVGIVVVVVLVVAALIIGLGRSSEEHEGMRGSLQKPFRLDFYDGRRRRSICCIIAT